MEPLHRSLGACLSLPSFAYFWKHFPTVISGWNGIQVCFEYETYLGYIARRCPSQTGFSFRGCMLCPVVRKQAASTLSFFFSSPLKEFEVCFHLHLVAASSQSSVLVCVTGKVLSTADHKWAHCDWVQMQLRRNKPYDTQLLWQSTKTLQKSSYLFLVFCTPETCYIDYFICSLYYTFQVLFFFFCSFL